MAYQNTTTTATTTNNNTNKQQGRKNEKKQNNRKKKLENIRDARITDPTNKNQKPDAHLVVDDDVDRSADGEVVDPRHLHCLVHHTLAGERSVSVDEDRHRPLLGFLEAEAERQRGRSRSRSRRSGRRRRRRRKAESEDVTDNIMRGNNGRGMIGRRNAGREVRRSAQDKTHQHHEPRMTHAHTYAHPNRTASLRLRLTGLVTNSDVVGLVGALRTSVGTRTDRSSTRSAFKLKIQRFHTTNMIHREARHILQPCSFKFRQAGRHTNKQVDTQAGRQAGRGAHLCVPVVELRGAGLSVHHRVHGLEVAGVGHQRQVDAVGGGGGEEGKDQTSEEVGGRVDGRGVRSRVWENAAMLTAATADIWRKGGRVATTRP